MRMATGKTSVITGVVVDVVSLILVFMPTIVLHFGHVKPFQRGFYCDDDSIRYPYHEDTVPWWSVLIVGLGVPIIWIIVTEIFHNYKKKADGSAPKRHSNADWYGSGRYDTVPSCIVHSYQLIGVFLFGLGVTLVVTDICKYSIGRPRPCFIDICRPNINLTDCVNVSTGFSVYVESFTCTGAMVSLYDDSRMSFLSGHTSMSYYCAVFFTLYLQARLTWKGSKLLKHLLQAVAIYAAVYVGLSRISDYKHHWSDVLMGAILGTFVAALVSIHVSNMFRSLRQKKYGDEERENRYWI